jgi:RNA polymerase sigma-70 factor (subfamily 1)
VQETLLEAGRDLPQFRGSYELELTAWLHRIMVRNLANQAKFHHRQRRDQARQVSLDAWLNPSGPLLEQYQAAPISSPSSHAIREEQDEILAGALSRLPPEQHAVVVLRIFKQRSLAEIAAALGRSEDACRKLWTRALTALQRTPGERP